jgi:hypothetical protein
MIFKATAGRFGSVLLRWAGWCGSVWGRSEEECGRIRKSRKTKSRVKAFKMSTEQDQIQTHFRRVQHLKKMPTYNLSTNNLHTQPKHHFTHPRTHAREVESPCMCVCMCACVLERDRKDNRWRREIGRKREACACVHACIYVCVCLCVVCVCCASKSFSRSDSEPKLFVVLACRLL